MPDVINYAIDLRATLKEVYDWTEDPRVGQIIAPDKEIAEVTRDEHGQPASFKTRRGVATYTLHEPPQRWQVEYLWRGYRGAYDVRLESFGEAWTRLTIELNIQAQSFLGRLFGPMTRGRYKRYLKERVDAALAHFKSA